MSGALTVVSAVAPSDAAGLLKEELDADGGSGFSFGDLLADRAGTTFASVATRDEASAAAIQARLAGGFRVDDFFPPADGLPEGIPDAELQSRYGGRGWAALPPHRRGDRAARRRLRRLPRVAPCARSRPSSTAGTRRNAGPEGAGGGARPALGRRGRGPPGPAAPLAPLPRHDPPAALPAGAARPRATRHRWAEAAFAAIRASRYTLATMLAQRVREHPGRTLFQESPLPGAPLLELRGRSRGGSSGRPPPSSAPQRGQPRVAILSSNGLDAACADLACLVHGIPVTPLNPETDPETLGFILDRLRVNVVVAETDELRARAERAPGAPAARLASCSTPPAPLRGTAQARLAEALAGLAPGPGASARSRAAVRRPSTSPRPSCSRPAAPAFRRASCTPASRSSRSASRARRRCPAVGEGEVLLCYLPLFHTFGRYLEMMGMLFWGGTYVFAGNPSFDTLARALPAVRPTGLVGIPRRWAQLRERCLARGRGGRGAARGRRATACAGGSPPPGTSTRRCSATSSGTASSCAAGSG